MLTGLLTGRWSPFRKSQFPTCEEGEIRVFAASSPSSRPCESRCQFGQAAARPMRSPAVRCELRRRLELSPLGEMVGLALARTTELALPAVLLADQLTCASRGDVPVVR